MNRAITKSVAILFAQIIKMDNRDVEKSVPLFCKIMGENFEGTHEQVKELLYKIMDEEYDLDEHIEIINKALCEDQLSKYHFLEQLNHIIYSDTITPKDYEYFENIKNKLFSC
ncbi:MAG: hypothetical protein OQK45_07270 [Sulfurovum sp.]|nr:hypothetical protein [Sulfurovum sp.]